MLKDYSNPSYYNRPHLVQMEEWWGGANLLGQRMTIPADIVRKARFIAVSGDSDVSRFDLVTTQGAVARRLSISVDRPLIGDVAEIVGGVDTDLVLSAEDWANKGSVETVVGFSALLRQFARGEVVIYPSVPDWFNDKRNPRPGDIQDMPQYDGATVFATAAEQILAIIPISGRKTLSIFVGNRMAGKAFEWRVEVAKYSLYTSNRVVQTQVYPYPSGVSSVAASSDDTIVLSNLAGSYAYVYGRPTVANDLLSNIDLQWETRD